MSEELERVRELLESFETAMLVTRGRDASLHARPMAIARVEAGCELWFFTGRSTAKVHEIENDQRVLIVCQDEMSRYVALSGFARLVVDRAKVSELWKESFKVWFPQGVSDPDLFLIRVQPDDAEYWDNQGFKSVRYLFEAAKAYVRGTRPHVDEPEQHGKVSFPE
jgi:general stress protein 26